MGQEDHVCDQPCPAPHLKYLGHEDGPRGGAGEAQKESRGSRGDHGQNRLHKTMWPITGQEASA